jgi:tetratricopeptide (TPR) repeat protein/DNA-binding XRE family transcriptional regulator
MAHTKAIATIDNDTFGSLLRGLRHRARLSQEELAARAGLSERTVRNLENGHARIPHRDTARLLADTLGISGPERDAFTAAARGDGPSGPATSAVPTGTNVGVPAQLPADVRGFAGRTEHLHRLDTMREAANSSGVGLAVITGSAGVGKTALAVHWAHRVRSHFPDGQLHVDLRGYATGTPLAPAEVLGRFLRALDAPAERIPADPSEAAALYRTRLAGRRILVVLDNANSPQQVRPLVPGTEGCFVVVTSRSRLAGLVARDAASMLALDVLSTIDAMSLLTQAVGVPHPATGTQTWSRLIHACARLPLALRIAAAHLAAHPNHPVETYVHRLCDGGALHALDAGGDADAAVRAAFTLSYETLPHAARALFRRLGLVAGPDVTADAAAALIAAPAERAERLLDQLAEVHLIEERRPGRYSFHDLLRCYAAERCSAEEPPDERRLAWYRLLRRYLAGVDAAAAELYPHALRLPRTDEAPSAVADPGPVSAVTDRAAALAWLDAERANVVAAIRRAATDGPRPTAWYLSDGLRRYFSMGMYTAQWRAAAEAALAAATAENAPAAQAAALFSLAQLHWAQSDYPPAMSYHRRAMQAARRAGWLEGQSSIADNLGIMHRLAGRLPQAAAEHRRALALNHRIGRTAGEAVNLCNLAVASWEHGLLRPARTQMTAALCRYRQLGSPSGEALALSNLGDIHHALGDLQLARGSLTAALGMHRELRDSSNEADALRCLAAVTADLGHLCDAVDLAETALATARRAGHRRYEIDTLNTLARLCCRLDRAADARRHSRRALALAEESGDRYPLVSALIALSTAACTLGDLDGAAGIAGRALSMASASGYRILEGLALSCMAELELRSDRPTTARRYAAAALCSARATGDRHGRLLAEHLLDAVGRSARRAGGHLDGGDGC